MMKEGPGNVPMSPIKEDETQKEERKIFYFLPHADTAKLAKERMQKVLEKPGYFSLSHEECVRYFGSKDFTISPLLKQGNFGDCYFVSALYALAQSPFFEVMVRSGVKKLEDGTWEVRMPLLSKDKKPVVLTPADFMVHENEKFLTRHNQKKILPDFRQTLKPIKGGEGYLALEAAFIKNKFGKVDRLLAESGHERDAFQALGGDFLEVVEIFKEEPDPPIKGYWPTLRELSEDQMKILDTFLHYFDGDLHVATLSTKALIGMPTIRRNLGRLTGSSWYKGKGMFKLFPTNHSYAVRSIDKENETITIVNPWNTVKPIVLTFDQMKDTFSDFCLARFDSSALISATDKASKEYRM